MSTVFDPSQHGLTVLGEIAMICTFLSPIGYLKPKFLTDNTAARNKFTKEHPRMSKLLHWGFITFMWFLIRSLFTAAYFPYWGRFVERNWIYYSAITAMQVLGTLSHILWGPLFYRHPWWAVAASTSSLTFGVILMALYITQESWISVGIISGYCFIMALVLYLHARLLWHLRGKAYTAMWYSDKKNDGDYVEPPSGTEEDEPL